MSNNKIAVQKKTLKILTKKEKEKKRQPKTYKKKLAAKLSRTIGDLSTLLFFYV